MNLPEEGYLLRIFIGESDKHEGKPLYEWLVVQARQQGLAGATVLRGMMGFGPSSRIHTSKILRLSEDLPLVIEMVDTKEKLDAFLVIVDEVVREGLVTFSGSSSVTGGMNRDTLLTIGWLDLSKGSQVLHVPDFSGRYYSVQLTDPSKNTNFAYVGTRATGTQAGGYLITGPGWKGEVPSGMTQIASSNNSVLVVGRVLVYNDSDLSTVYGLSKQIQLTPLNHWQPGQ